MPKIYSPIISLSTVISYVNGWGFPMMDFGFGVFKCQICIDYDRPKKGISTHGYSVIIGAGWEDLTPAASPISHFASLRIDGDVNSAGVFTTDRTPKNPVGAPMNVQNDIIKTGGTRSIRVVIEKTAEIPNTGSMHRIGGIVYLEYSNSGVSAVTPGGGTSILIRRSSNLRWTTAVHKV